MWRMDVGRKPPGSRDATRPSAGQCSGHWGGSRHGRCRWNKKLFDNCLLTGSGPPSDQQRAMARLDNSRFAPSHVR